MNRGSPTTSHEKHEGVGPEESSSTEQLKYRKYICGEEALRISPSEPYCLHRPVRRGHFNVSQDYPMQQVCFCRIILEQIKLISLVLVIYKKAGIYQFAVSHMLVVRYT